MRTDLLNLDYINSLPQPLLAMEWGDTDWWWPVEDICVETGLMRIDVCGRLQVKHIRDFKIFRDTDSVCHDAETFYLEEPAITINCPRPKGSYAKRK